VIENVTCEDRYTLKYWQLILLSKVYNNNLINGCSDIFRYGFINGQKSERAKYRKRNKKVA